MSRSWTQESHRAWWATALMFQRAARFLPQRQFGAHAGGGTDLLLPVAVRLQVDVAEQPVGEALRRLHDVEIEIRPHAEELQHLIEHLAMLRRHAEPHAQAWLALQGLDHGQHLDGLGPRPEYHEDFLLHAS